MSIKNYIASSAVCSLLALVLAGCESASVSKLIQASGKPGEVMLVMDADKFETRAAYELIEMLEEPAPALPTLEEKRLSVTSRVPSSSFTSMMRRARNIIIVDVDSTRFSKSTLKFSHDEWAAGQIILQLNVPSLDSLSTFVRDKEEIVINLLVRHELYRFGRGLEEAYSQRATELVDSLVGYRINVPRDVRSHKFKEDFLWMSNAKMERRQDLLVYSYPLMSKADIGLDRMVAVRDSVLKVNIPGEFEGTYPSTVKTGLIYRKVQLPNQPIRGEVRGLWQMEGGAMMGGPFVMQAHIDSLNGRVVVCEGFVYNPNADKLNLIRTMEAALYSFRPREVKDFVSRRILEASYSKQF